MTTQVSLRELIGTSSHSEISRPEEFLKGAKLWKEITQEAQMQNPGSALSASSNEANSSFSTSKSTIFESSIQEEILGWWTGTVTAITGKTFIAELCDLESKKSIVEMERRNVGEAQEGDIQVGARLVYSISRKEDTGGAKVESQLQFLPSYLWALEDESYIQKRVHEIYEDDSQYFQD